MAAKAIRRADGEWIVRVTVPRKQCVSSASRDRRTTVLVGPGSVARSIADEVNGLINSAALLQKPVRARDLLRQATVALEGRLPGASPAAATITVADYGPAWLETTKGSTRTKYGLVYRNYIEPEFGRLPLNRIKRRVIREWLQGMEAHLAPATASCYFGIFLAMLAQAVRDGEIETHPCPSIRAIRSTKPKAAPKEPRFLSVAELASLIRAARAIDSNYNRRGVIEFMAATGCRIGEARGLRWTDVDFDDRRATIRRKVYNGAIGPTKGRNTRHVELGPGMLCDLRALRAAQRRRALERGRRAGRYVFQAPNGRCWRYCVSIRAGVWVKALVEAGLAGADTKLRGVGLGTHVLRHTWATHRLQEGVPAPDVARALGHSLETLLKTYAHAVPAENRERLRVDLDAIV